MRRTPSSTHTSTLMPYTTLFRSQETLILCTDTLCQFRDHCSPDVLGPFSLTFSFSLLARLTRVRQAQSSTTPRRMGNRSEEHTSELQSLMRISYAVFCLEKKSYNAVIQLRIIGAAREQNQQ